MSAFEENQERGDKAELSEDEESDSVTVQSMSRDDKLQRMVTRRLHEQGFDTEDEDSDRETRGSSRTKKIMSGRARTTNDLAKIPVE